MKQISIILSALLVLFPTIIATAGEYKVEKEYCKSRGWKQSDYQFHDCMVKEGAKQRCLAKGLKEENPEFKKCFRVEQAWVECDSTGAGRGSSDFNFCMERELGKRR
ncbi:MAG: hypothetical protein Q8P84_07655 [Deltaproteobacteria bacterium]|nr:hypothetical protein [Deltaproteobacteria bacterium]